MNNPTTYSGLNPTDGQQHLRRMYLILMGALLLSVGLVNNTNPVRDGDVFFHLKYGEYHVQHQTPVMDHSIFSWTQAPKDSPYCTWAADIFFYAIYQLGGWPLLFAFRYVCMFFPVLVAWLYARQVDLGTHIFTPIVLIFLQLAMDAAGYIKPEMLSMLFFVLIAFLYFWIKKNAANHRQRRLFWLYPLIFLFWVNMHGVVFFGLALLAAIICGEIINYLTKSKHAFIKKDLAILIFSGLSSAAVTLLNPYGINLHQNFINLSISGVAADLNYAVRAFQPLANNLLNYGVKYSMQHWGIMVTLLAILLFSHVRKTRHWDFGILLPNLLLGTLFLAVNRTIYYWPAFWAMSLFHLAGKDRLNFSAVFHHARPWVKLTLISVLTALTLFFSLRVIYKDIYTPRRWSYFGLGFNYTQPVQESAFLKKHKIGTKFYNTYNTGSYLLFDLFPAHKVFIDSRYFPYKENNIFSKYFGLTYGTISVDQLEAEFGFDTALVEHSYPALHSFITTKGWKPAYYGTVGVIFVKDHIELPYDVRKLDQHRLDGIKNLVQAYDVATTAHNLGDLEAAAYVIASMEKHVSHLVGYQTLRTRLSLCQQGLEAYAREDFDKALKVLWRLGFQKSSFRANALLRQLINKKADVYVKEGEFRKAVGVLEPILAYHPDDIDVLYDVGVVAYLAYQKGHDHRALNGIKWQKLLTRFVATAPADHDYANIAKQLLANHNIPDTLPLILNSKIENEKLRTF